jgi:hypothetical protein
MVTQQNTNLERVGLIIAFDADTGEVLHVHEKVVETVDGSAGYSTEITSEECGEIRELAAQDHCNRRVDVITDKRPSDEDLRYHYHVDPMTRVLRAERAIDPKVQMKALARYCSPEP